MTLLLSLAMLAGAGRIAPAPSASSSASVPLTSSATNYFVVTNSDTVLSSNYYTGGTWGQDWQLNPPTGFGYVDASSATPTVCTVRVDGVAAYVADGTATLRVRYEDASRVVYGGTIQLSTVGSGANYSLVNFSNFVTGSLGASAKASLTNSGTVDLWNEGTTNRTATSWLLNATNLAAIPSQLGYARGVLISSNVVLRASHAKVTNETTYYFRTAAGALVTATTLTNIDLGQDICVTLISPAPGIAPMKLVPSNWTAYAKGATTQYGFPVVAASVTNFCTARAFYSSVSNCVTYPDTVFDPSRTWSGSASSGEPVMIYARGELFCLGTWWFFDRAPVASHYLATINAAITNMAAAFGQPTNAASVADWSSFTAY